jgi:hypothetical protein
MSRKVDVTFKLQVTAVGKGTKLEASEKIPHRLPGNIGWCYLEEHIVPHDQGKDKKRGKSEKRKNENLEGETKD